MILIANLGTRIIGNMGNTKSFGLYECPVCLKHFECTTSSITSGNTTKCFTCARNIANKSIATLKVARHTLEFPVICNSVHSDKYDYSLVDYINVKTKVKIICPNHGIFQQTPSNHKNGRGCPLCAEYGFNASKSALLYYLCIHHEDLVLYKIGITNRTVQERFTKEELNKIEVISVYEYQLGSDAYNKEQEILKQYSHLKYIGPPILTSGNSEIFYENIDII